MRPKRKGLYQVFNGEYFGLDEKSGYWQNTKTRERMHRYVWKHFYGEIPTGFHIHHLDGDKSNNDISNLAMISASAHLKLHGENQNPETLEKKKKNCDNVRYLTKAWHASKDGREWHKAHYQKTKDALHERFERVCDFCGKTFMGTKTSKFCCNACKSAYRRKMGFDNVEKVCIVCGKTFVANKYDKGKTCSRECAAKLRKRMKG